MTQKAYKTRREVPPAESALPSEAGGRELKTLNSAQLFADAKEVIIEHQNDRYRLRCTSKGKLILTK